MAATIKDIARKLNISVSTVSYALNDGPRTVPEDVKKRVLQAAQELQYRPNRVARSLVTRRSFTIGIVPSEASSDIVLSPYLQNSLNGIVNAAEELHYDVLFFTRYDQSQVRQMSDILLDGRVDGLIFLAPPRHSPVLDIIAEHSIPHVVIAGEPHSHSVQYSVDNTRGVEALIEHMAEQGHRTFGHFYGRMEMEDAIERRETFMKCVERLGLETREEWIHPGNFTMQGGDEAMHRLMKCGERPTAIFCANDEIAIGAIGAARSYGLTPPKDFIIAGFDNVPLSSVFLPSVTTVRQPVETIATLATRTLIAMIDGKTGHVSQVLPTELIVRDSTSRPKEDFQ